MAKAAHKRTTVKDLIWEDEYTTSDIFWEYECLTGDSDSTETTLWIPVKDEESAKHSALLPGATGNTRSKICWVREVPNEKYEIVDITDWKVENQKALARGY